MARTQLSAGPLVAPYGASSRVAIEKCEMVICADARRRRAARRDHGMPRWEACHHTITMPHTRARVAERVEQQHSAGARRAARRVRWRRRVVSPGGHHETPRIIVSDGRAARRDGARRARHQTEATSNHHNNTRSRGRHDDGGGASRGRLDDDDDGLRACTWSTPETACVMRPNASRAGQPGTCTRHGREWKERHCNVTEGNGTEREWKGREWNGMEWKGMEWKGM